MDEMQKIQYAANSYYNRGLEMAKERNLSGAARFLKRALQFNKYHTDARNLLGLIFYEMGETSDALIQWVISINLQPDGNRADYYLDEVQRKPGQLEIASQMVKKFNQALFYAQNDSDDLAVLQLKRIVDEKLRPTRRTRAGSPSSTSVLVLSWVRSWSCSSSCRRGSEH